MLKYGLAFPLLLLGCVAVNALPNSILGPLARVDSPLNGQDITEQLFASALWSGETSLPGEWKAESSIASAQVSHLLARPKFIGEDVLLTRATHRGKKLESITLTFVDAGSYFTYTQPARTKEGLEALRKTLIAKQEKFTTLYQESHQRIKKRLEAIDSGRMKQVKQGSSRTLRAELSVYRKGDLFLSLLADGERMIRVTISQSIPHKKSWLDESRSTMSAYDRSKHYRGQVKLTEAGDTLIQGVSVVPQGYRPYCGINTLVMASHYFGLHIDEDWLAVSGGFQNTGSAGNSNILRLYNAVASEARLKLSRETKFNFGKARGLIREGLPVLVWRKFDYQRNALHHRITKLHLKDPSVQLPAPTPKDRASWPGKNHPVHASVIVGFNDKRKEVLFLDSWAGISVPRRMRYEEMEATATWVFYFRNQ